MGTQLFACGYLGDPTTEPLHELTAVAVPEAVEKFYAGFRLLGIAKVSAAVSCGDLNPKPNYWTEREGFGAIALLTASGCLLCARNHTGGPAVVSREVTAAALSWQCCAAICRDGRLLSGFAANDSALEAEASGLCEVELPEAETLLQAAAGDVIGMVVAGSGALYTWKLKGSGSLPLTHTDGKTDETQSSVQRILATRLRLPTQSPTSPFIASQVACGSRHFAAITDSGQLFCWGWNLHSQCGGVACSHVAPLSARHIALPPHLQCLQAIVCSLRGSSCPSGTDHLHRWTPPSYNYNFVTGSLVAAGHGHTAALCSDGSAYGWGLNADGQLGTGDTIGRSSPTLIELSPDADIKQAFGCGWGKWGQLGLPLPDSSSCLTSMTAMPVGAARFVAQAACGRWSTLLSTRDDCTADAVLGADNDKAH